jgi:hypothetical protein
VPEVVVDGVTGVICDQPEQLPAAIRAVAGLDPAACRAHVAEHFGVDNLAAGYERAYRAAAALTGAARALPGARRPRWSGALAERRFSGGVPRQRGAVRSLSGNRTRR